MNESKVALRYAKAVLDLAIDHKAADKVGKDMRGIVATISGSKELQELLGNPVVGGAIKRDILKTIFKESDPITQGLFSLLVEKRRVSMLNEVALKYIILNEQYKGQHVAFVTTAIAMTPELENKILDKVIDLTGGKASLENHIDENIIGGFILRIGDLQYDASIANTLGNLKRAFTNNL